MIVVDTSGSGSRGPLGCASGRSAPITPSGTFRIDAPPAQVVREYWARMAWCTGRRYGRPCDHAGARVPAVLLRDSGDAQIQFLDRLPHFPVATQRQVLTVQIVQKTGGSTFQRVAADAPVKCSDVTNRAENHRFSQVQF